MALTIFFISFFVLLFLGFRVALALAVPSVFYLLYIGVPLSTLAIRMVTTLNSFPILAALFFILAGNLMNECRITNKIFDFAADAVGHWRGGLGHANVIASVIFSGMSGSALADAAGLGTIEIKAMTERGYSREFSVGITGASAIIGPIIPPSIPIIIYAVIAEVSVGRLFAAGIFPGLLMGILLSIMIVVISRKEDFPISKKTSYKIIWKSFIKTFPALLVIVVILGGIFGGIFTPTEAAVVTVLYTILISIFIYKTFNFRLFIKTLRNSARTTALIMFIVAAASLFNQVIIREQIAIKLASSILNITNNPVIILILINFSLLILGMFLEQIASIILVTPIIIPLVMQLGYSATQFGIVIILNLMIGLLTPPLGLVLYVLMDVGELTLERAIRGIAPFLIPLIICLLLVTFIPILTEFIPKLIFG
jgi:tripartite ATP-independent transporter DctM subunit